MEPRQRPVFALGLRVIAAFAIATMFMLCKRTAESGVSLPEMMFWRQFVTLPMLLGYLIATKSLSDLRTTRINSHAMRAGVGTAGMFCNFAAVTLLPLAESTTLSFTTPLFAVMITALIMRDHVGVWRWTAVACGFAGVLVITQPGHVPIPALGAAVGLLAAMFTATTSFQIRDLGRTEKPVSVVLYYAVFGTAIMAVFLPFTYTPHTPQQWLLLLGIGVTGTIGQLFMTAALRIGSVASVVVMDYTAIIWATFYGWLLWNQLPSPTTWLGAPLIIAAGIVIAWREHRLARMGTPLSVD